MNLLVRHQPISLQHPVQSFSFFCRASFCRRKGAGWKIRGARFSSFFLRTLRIEHFLNGASDVGGVAAEDEFEAVV